MKKDNAKCKFCESEITGETCLLAAYSMVIDGKEYRFCCQTCANQYKQEKAKEK